MDSNEEPVVGIGESLLDLVEAQRHTKGRRRGGKKRRNVSQVVVRQAPMELRCPYCGQVYIPGSDASAHTQGFSCLFNLRERLEAIERQLGIYNKLQGVAGWALGAVEPVYAPSEHDLERLKMIDHILQTEGTIQADDIRLHVLDRARKMDEEARP